MLVLLVGTHLTETELLAVTMVSKLLARVVPEIKTLSTLNWKPSVQLRPDYDNQKQGCMNRVDVATALAVQCGLDPGKNIRTFGDEYTGEWRDVNKMLEWVKSVVSKLKKPIFFS